MPHPRPRTGLARLLRAAASFLVLKARLLRRGRFTLGSLLIENARLREENSFLRARLKALPPAHRPRYTPLQRARILDHQTLHGLGIEQTAGIFLLTVATVRRWWKDAHSPSHALVRTPGPLNRTAQIVEELARLLRLALPSRFGTRTIAGHLVRLGARISRSTVQRVLKRTNRPPDEPERLAALARKYPGVKAKRPGHVWILDFTRAPNPGATGELWIGAILDVFSRAVVAFKSCAGQPTAKFATRLLDSGIAAAGKPPKHAISDQGTQFKSKRFKRWLRRNGIRHRYGAVGSSRSIAILERWWRTLKETVPWIWRYFPSPASLERYVAAVVSWYNAERPHAFLKGRSPHDVRYGRRRKRRDFTQPGRWRLAVRWIGPSLDLPVVRLRRVA